MKTIRIENDKSIVEYDELLKAVENLDKNQIIHICKSVINGNLDKDREKIFMEAMKDGVDLVRKKYEGGEYNIKHIIFMRNILDEVMSMIED